LTLALQDFFNRDIGDAGLQFDHRQYRLYVQAAVGCKAAFVEIAAQVFEGQHASLAVGLERGILDGQFAEGQLAKTDVGIEVQGLEASHWNDFGRAPTAFGRRVRQGCIARCGQCVGFAALYFSLAGDTGAIGFG